MERFEQFIEHLLKQADQADALRNLASENSTLHDSIDILLLEHSIAAQFDPVGYQNESVKEKVLNKLNHVKMILDRNLVKSTSLPSTLIDNFDCSSIQK